MTARQMIWKWKVYLLLLAVLIASVLAMLLGVSVNTLIDLFTIVFVWLALVILLVFGMILVAGFMGIKR